MHNDSILSVLEIEEVKYESDTIGSGATAFDGKNVWALN